jgi:hypothetical protein
VWLYFRFPLSYREVEELMLQRGVIVSYETIRRWCAKFGQAYANGLRRRRPRPGDKWHLDEVFIKVNGVLASRYKRIAIRRGKKRALVAVGHTILTSIWPMLTNDAEYTDLGADYFLQRTGRTRQTRRLVSQLNMLGYQVSLQSAESG